LLVFCFESERLSMVRWPDKVIDTESFTESPLVVELKLSAVEPLAYSVDPVVDATDDCSDAVLRCLERARPRWGHNLGAT
jgi:hypothetical protein